ncbi:MAG: hypothetical protein GY790_18690 [Bacteroidetes bacterium]|nr:hypothetical protein [Bacteroidota bacterium]
MKQLISISLGGFLLLLASCTGPGDSDLHENWLNPPLAYRMNRNLHNFPLDASGQDSLIRATLDNGWGGFALNVPFHSYLTDEGMKATKRFCDQAKALGMDLWLYDEEGYPSGNAGDLVIKEDPTRESMALYLKDSLVNGGEVAFLMPPGIPELIVAFPVKEGIPDYKHPKDLMGLYDGSWLEWRAPSGEWNIFAVTKYRLYEGYQAAIKGGGKVGANYPSLMMREVTDAFMRITHERYADYMGEDLGKYFTSTFTDEPSTMAVQFHTYAYNHAVVPWQEVLSEEMEKRYGYRPEGKLVELYFDDGPTGQRVRYQYFHTVGDLMTMNYFAPIKEWCEAHQFQSGGHLLLEETMIAHVPLYGNIMQCFRAMHAPGIDILSCFPDQMPVHSPKLASSSAELMGHSRVMAEPCPVADRQVLDGKETPAESVRGHLNMLLQGGITDFNCYLQLSNSDQDEKNEFNTYVGRINILLQGGYTASDIGIVYPIESLWTKFKPRYHKVEGWTEVSGATEEANSINQSFIDVSRFAFDHRWEYTHLDAQALIDGEVSEASLDVDPFQFKVIVLPSVNTMPEAAWSNLKKYAEMGGRIIFLEDTPMNSDVNFPDREVQDDFAQLISENDNVVFMSDWTPEELDEQLDAWLEKVIILEDESLNVGLAHKRIDGKDVFFVLNDSKEEIRTGITFNTRDKLEEWDPDTGEISSFSNGSQVVLKPYHGKIYRAIP